VSTLRISAMGPSGRGKTFDEALTVTQAHSRVKERGTVRGSESREIDSRSPAFAGEMFRGNDCTRERQSIANVITTKNTLDFFD